MTLKKPYKLFVEIICFCVLIFLDQLTKYLAIEHLKEGKIISIIKNVFEFRYLENTGAAFGILNNRMIFFIIVTIIVTCGIIYIKYKINFQLYKDSIQQSLKKKYLILDVVLLILLSGAIGNFIDRIRYDYVVDFIYFRLINFPIFNLADCYVSISAVLLVIMFIFVLKENEYHILFSKKGKVGEE